MSYSTRVDEAMALALKLHRDQSRKSTRVPYVTHLWAVAAIVGENEGSEDEVIAALLHDAVEDQGGQSTLKLIREKFGNTVADIVWGCTDADAVPKPPWRKRKVDYIDRLRSEDLSVVRVSIADKIHNSRSILADYRKMGSDVWKKFTGGREGTLWYYHELVKVYLERLPGPLADEISRIVAELTELDAKQDSR